MILIYGQGEAGSIVKRMKALELSFSGVFGMGGASPLWAKLIGSDGDFVVTPGQWHPALRSTCEAFGSAANFSSQFAARFGRAPNYHAAMEANTGLILQYAMQVLFPAQSVWLPLLELCIPDECHCCSSLGSWTVSTFRAATCLLLYPT